MWLWLKSRLFRESPDGIKTYSLRCAALGFWNNQISKVVFIVTAAVVNHGTTVSFAPSGKTRTEQEDSSVVLQGRGQPDHLQKELFQAAAKS